MIDEYICPVCGFGRLRRPPANHVICCSCGTQFDYDDQGVSHGFLHQQWVDQGCPWFSQATPEPEGWAVFRRTLLTPRVYQAGRLISAVAMAEQE